MAENFFDLIAVGGGLAGLMAAVFAMLAAEDVNSAMPVHFGFGDVDAEGSLQQFTPGRGER